MLRFLCTLSLRKHRIVSMGKVKLLEKHILRGIKTMMVVRRFEDT